MGNGNHSAVSEPRKFRHHREMYADSMATVVVVHTMQDLKREIGTKKTITVSKYGDIDPRNGWDTHIVTANGEIPFGFLDGPLK